MTALEQYLPFWAQLSAAQQTMLLHSVDTRSYPKGTALHTGSNDCTGLLVVIKGQLRVYSNSVNGKELTLYRLLPRDICLLSASCIMRGIQFDVAVSCEEDTTLFVIPPEVYRTLMDASAAVSNYTNEWMALRFSDVMWLMDQILTKKLDSRLSAFLLEEQRWHGSQQLTLTHEQIANHLGTVREVITRMLKYFQKEGLVQLGRGSIQLTDLPQLNALAAESRR